MPPQIEITITLSADGQLLVNGQIDNKIVALGMLDIARQVIFNHGAGEQKEQSKLLIANGPMPERIIPIR